LREAELSTVGDAAEEMTELPIDQCGKEATRRRAAADGLFLQATAYRPQP
jgi:hypothetical protein